jgi:hypothetical protein
MMIGKDENIVIGLSAKSDGNMKLGGPAAEETARNRQEFFMQRGIDPKQVVAAKLAHGSRVAVVSAGDKGKIIEDTDGLVCRGPGIVLAITVADCLPVYFYDPSALVIGLAHGGWRGIQKGIIENMCQAMLKDLGGDAARLSAYIGPHIRACHYEVNRDVWRHFDDIDGAVYEKNGNIYLSLARVVKSKLKYYGLKSRNIEISDECTHCRKKKYFSFRRDKPGQVEAMVAYIGINSKPQITNPK